ncbi:hypothetical protein CALCODRAFT_433190 [Calocera cornea HHB12733]|uniref:CHAT domain-containing protein n=1 Tax=Calocera cornea HHB12733 TaxID=1353952 RepID=A0A165GI87_9BASI|nr:hypothetical protein CALCODRAFT_433190 [Calocera cornea HHB12733]
MIITATEPLVQIPLPDLPSSIVSKLAYTLQQALQTAKDARGVQFLEGVLLGVCRRLWFGGLGTIAAYLQDHGERQGLDEPFRVWWMPTGMLSMLPIHCAGPYDQTLGGLYELFISSYTTTLSALLQGRVAATPPASPVKPFSVLAVAQPQALGAPYLRYAEAEVQGLATSQLANYVTILSGDSATISQFEAELPEHEWLHCCCHARWDPTSPLDSAFRLRDGNFSLGSIIHMRLKKAQFAFLSACHTARHSTILPDESMHLAAGMQIAGFRGVLATQWGMVDKDGPALVELFYGCLAEAGFPPDPRNAAEALHWSLQQLRERGMPMFRWALFVHIGI